MKKKSKNVDGLIRLINIPEPELAEWIVAYFETYMDSFEMEETLKNNGFLVEEAVKLSRISNANKNEDVRAIIKYRLDLVEKAMKKYNTDKKTAIAIVLNVVKANPRLQVFNMLRILKNGRISMIDSQMFSNPWGKSQCL
jgi:hypothetical protein